MTDSGRETRAYVSAYDRSRVHQSRLYRFEKRRLVANFGALLGERLIRCATWSIDRPEIGVMSDPQISDDARETSVMFAAQLGGWATVRCQITLDSGEQYVQVFRVNVRRASWFVDDAPILNGPFSLRVCREDPPPPPPPQPEAVFIVGYSEVGDGEEGWGYIADEMGTLVSSTFDDPTLYGIYSSSGLGGQVYFWVIGSEPVPADAFTVLEIYRGSDFETLELSLDISDAETVAFGNHRIWSWASAGNFFSGESGNTFGIRAVKI
jgi:hypothetical protein